jgi:amidase
MSRLEFSSAADLVALQRSGDVSSCELLDLFLERVASHSEAVNAVVTLDATGARAAAENADRARARGESLGPLHGLPMTVKDTFETAGLRTTAGVEELADHVPARDALAVARLRAAGAVIFGKTNTPTWAGDWQTVNPIFGVTNNPWDSSRTPGGSSGGSAAALASGQTPLELGSDIGGSIRVPAHWSGVCGHKGSHGLVPQRGHLPGYPGSLFEADLNVVGPLARNVADLKLAFDVLAGPLPEQATAWSLRLPPPRGASLGEYRVAAWLDDPCCPVDQAMRVVLEAGVEALAREGAKVDVRARPDVDFRDAVFTYLELLLPLNARTWDDEQFELFVGAAAELPEDVPEFQRHLAGALVARYRTWQAASERREQVRARWAEFFRDYDILLCPVILSAAIEHDYEVPQQARSVVVNGEARPYLEQIFWPGLITMSLLPSTVVPVGRTSAGLPVGIQVVGPYLEDRSTLDYAERLCDVVGSEEFSIPPGF